MDESVIAELEASLTNALQNAVGAPKEQSSLLRREAAVELREASIREQLAALERDKQRLYDRERKLDERERKLDERETQLFKRETARIEALLATQGATTLAEASPTKKVAARKADPIDDVPALVEMYQTSGGIVPLGVLVAEVEALQQAATRLRANAASCEEQLKQLETTYAKAAEGVGLSTQTENVKRQTEALKKEKERFASAEAKLVERFGKLRDKGVERFTPLLLQSAFGGFQPFTPPRQTNSPEPKAQ